MARHSIERIGKIAQGRFGKGFNNESMCSVAYPGNPVDAARGLMIGGVVSVALWALVLLVI